jgi:hypothetical protein
MSAYDTLINALGSAVITDITASDIAYDNYNFDPEGKSAWLSAFYMPAITSTLSKNYTREEVGIFQISIYVQSNDKEGGSVKYGTRTNQITSDIESTFYANAVLTYNSISVTIQETTIQRGNDANGWYEQILSINYVRNIS